LRNAVRSHGAYFGGSDVRASDAVEADFLWFAETVDFGKGALLEAEADGTSRRFFACRSTSAEELKSTLLTSFDDNEVVDLLPIPFRSALNFLFVAFIVAR